MATSMTSEGLIPIDCHFKVKAGPGAGKTHWLINHVKNVIKMENCSVDIKLLNFLFLMKT